MQAFCPTCKQHVEYTRLEDFFSSGHDTQPVKRLQRNMGRKQRSREWERDLTVAA